MGARAHNRRHEGRRIRRQRRQIARQAEAIVAYAERFNVSAPAIAEGFSALARAASAAIDAMAHAFVGLGEGLLARPEAQMTNHPSEGGQELTEALRAPGALSIDEAAAELGVELLPWQRDAGQRILNGERVVLARGRSAGRTALQHVIHHAVNRGATVDMAWIDEAAQMDLKQGESE